MKKICKWSTIVLITMSLCGLISCNKDNVELVDQNYKTLKVLCEGDFEIPVLVNNWNIEYIKDATGQYILGKDGNPLALDGRGKVEASNGWLALSRDNKESFIISLKENFDKSNERKFLICINDAGKRDYVTVVQQAGTEYKLIKSKYEEIEEQRSIYESDKECTSIVLSNYSSEERWESLDEIFKDVVETSIFESNDYGAFDWLPKESAGVDVPDLIINDSLRWGGKSRVYKEGINTISYNGFSHSILMKPNSTLYFSGKVTYCKRVCNYTFTIQNMRTGTQFEIRGVWTQIVPIVSHIICSDKEYNMSANI